MAQLKKSYGPNAVVMDDKRAFFVGLASFCSTFIVLGFAYSIGIFYVVFLDAFKSSMGVTAWISSLNFGILCLVGPLASVLITRQGCRVTMFLGGVISSMGLIISSMAPNLMVLFVSLGVITGSGFGLVFAASVVVITFHFERYRTLAMGLALSGSGVGTIVYPWIHHALLDEYNWRGTLLVAAALNLNVCVCAMLLHPTDNNNVIFHRENKSSEKSHSSAILNIFSNLRYCLIHVSCVLFTFGMSVVYTHISAYSRTLILTRPQGSFLLSAIGLFNLFGRIGLGALGQLNSVDVPTLFFASYFIAGAAVIIIGFSHTFMLLLTDAILFGFFSGAFGPLLSEVTCMVVGVDTFSYAYGYLMVSMALGTMLGAPAAGFLYDLTSLYSSSFHLGGTSIVCSSLAVLIIKFLQTKKKTILVSEATFV